MDPVGRRTRRRTEEAPIKQCQGYKKAKTGSTRQVTALSTSPSASLGSSTSSSPTSITESATPSPVLRDLEREAEEEEEVSRSFSYDSCGSYRREVEDDVVFVSSETSDQHASDDPDSDDESEEEDGSISSGYDVEDEEEEEIENGARRVVKKRGGPKTVEEHVKPRETEYTRSSSSDPPDSDGEMDTKSPNQVDTGFFVVYDMLLIKCSGFSLYSL